MKAVDAIVAVLAVAIGLTVVLPLLGVVLHSYEFDETRAKVVAGLLSSMIAIVSVYVGSRLKDKHDE
jgi:hypothetical protein